MPKPLPDPNSAKGPWALFLDIDGTLLELANRPDGVVVPHGLVGLLDRLHYKFRGACALVSGRNLSFIDSTLQWKTRDAAGCHGAEIRVNGTVIATPSDPEELRRVTDRLIAAAATIPGALVEIKGRSIAFHYGGTSLTSAQALSLAKDAADVVSHALRIVPVRSAIEILPREAGKGRAIADFLTYGRYWGLIPVFAGDDVMDEEGFREVNSRGGISIRVGERKTTVAKYHAKSVDELRGWLMELSTSRVARSLGGRKRRRY